MGLAGGVFDVTDGICLLALCFEKDVMFLISSLVYDCIKHGIMHMMLMANRGLPLHARVMYGFVS